jgi:DHA3 family macrolide efflux protein-like MFS transporter
MIPALGVLLGLVLGLAVGGRIDNLLDIRLRWLPALLGAAIARIGLEVLLAVTDVPFVIRMWLVLVTYSFLSWMLLANRNLPGMTAAALGTISNGIAIVVNGGWMPVWQPSLAAAGFDPTAVHSSFYTLLEGPLDASFLAHAGPLADVLPVPVPIIASVASIGDILLGAGLAFFLFAAVVRAPVLVRTAIPVPAEAGAIPAVPALPAALARHPYVRLATNGPFSAMWLGQVVSALGDRLHQIALVYLVLRATDSSPLALGLTFAAMTVPTFAVGPVAGAFVDRWDRKWTMVGSDVLRAALVAAIPAAAVLHVSLVVALVLLVAVCSTFFRPARSAALPQVVPDEDLLTANSAIWVADTATDLVGYGLGGLFVTFLGDRLSLAFWLDSASYLASAGLVAAVTIPRVAPPEVRASIREDLAAGWRFLRHETVLFATTVQASIAEYGLGALTALSPLLIAALPLGGLEPPTAYGLFDMTLGAGLVGGGIVLGAVAAKVPKGPAIVAGFTAIGVALILFAVVGNLWIVLGLAGVVGLANVTFVIPSQTVFQQRTPGELMGRVVAMRLAMVNATLAAAMATSGLFAELFGLPVVFAACGVVTAAAGLAGLAFKAIREA